MLYLLCVLKYKTINKVEWTLKYIFAVKLFLIDTMKHVVVVVVIDCFYLHQKGRVFCVTAFWLRMYKHKDSF